MSIISTHGLTMLFGQQRALDAVSVDLESGITGLIGANGAGKTTLMSLVLGLRLPTSGSLLAFGLSPKTDGASLRAKIGFGPESNLLPTDLRATDFVKHMAELRGMPRKEARGRASDALWLVGLGEERSRPMGTMSTGQRQRVKLAQAIAGDPELLLLDEPTDGLDPIQRAEMLNLISRISKDFGISVLLSSHQLEEVERICDRIVALDAGRLVAAGAISEVTAQESGLVIELADTAGGGNSAAMVAEAIGRAGVDVRIGQTPWHLEVVGPDMGEVADLVRDAIAEARARVVRIEPRRRSIEDLFEAGAR